MKITDLIPDLETGRYTQFTSRLDSAGDDKWEAYCPTLHPFLVSRSDKPQYAHTLVVPPDGIFERPGYPTFVIGDGDLLPVFRKYGCPMSVQALCDSSTNGRLLKALFPGYAVTASLGGAILMDVVDGYRVVSKADTAGYYLQGLHSRYVEQLFPVHLHPALGFVPNAGVVYPVPIKSTGRIALDMELTVPAHMEALCELLTLWLMMQGARNIIMNDDIGPVIDNLNDTDDFMFDCGKKTVFLKSLRHTVSGPDQPLPIPEHLRSTEVIKEMERLHKLKGRHFRHTPLTYKKDLP